MNAKEEYIKSHKKYAKRELEFTFDVDWIPEIPNEWPVYRMFGVLNSEELIVHLPFDRNLYQPVKDYFESIGWNCVADRTDESKLDEYDFWTVLVFSEEVEYNHWGKKVAIRFEPGLEGSVCRRKVVGYVDKKVPVIEFACE